MPTDINPFAIHDAYTNTSRTANKVEKMHLDMIGRAEAEESSVNRVRDCEDSSLPGKSDLHSDKAITALLKVHAFRTIRLSDQDIIQYIISFYPTLDQFKQTAFKKKWRERSQTWPRNAMKMVKMGMTKLIEKTGGLQAWKDNTTVEQRARAILHYWDCQPLLTAHCTLKPFSEGVDFDLLFSRRPRIVPLPADVEALKGYSRWMFFVMAMVVWKYELGATDETLEKVKKAPRLKVDYLEQQCTTSKRVIDMGLSESTKLQ